MKIRNNNYNISRYFRTNNSKNYHDLFKQRYEPERGKYEFCTPLTSKLFLEGYEVVVHVELNCKITLKSLSLITNY